MKAVVVFTPGGPESLRYTDWDKPKAVSGSAIVRIEAIGLNYIDVYHRTGLYPKPTPFVIGMEAAGVVESVGAGVAEVEPGMRVASMRVPGAYAQYAAVPAELLVPLPDDIDSRTAAAAVLQGMTAHYLTTDTYELKRGDTALVHAAAGGVGGLLVQMCKKVGAYVFATASTRKLDAVRESGADEVIDYTRDDFEQVVSEATEGKGVNVVYDSVGAATFEKSLRLVKTRGTLVMYGQASGPVEPLNILELSKRSIYLTRPTLGAYISNRDELLRRAGDLFAAIGAGEVKVRIDRDLPLSEAAEAHRVLEARDTVGKVLLIPPN